METIKLYWNKVKTAVLCSPIVLFLVLLLGGCGATLPVVQNAPSCNTGLSVQVLAEPCDKPSVLVVGSTYEVLAKDDKLLRRSLQSCSAKIEALQDSAKKCQEAIDRHNQNLTVINQPS